ncbi:uncharacterized protein [Aquarana catesbeiana]|uniref:uncharacterized protein n=1 Tax=Aquarana catesbeiana TaxID=8400 RepID=UPI003CCA6942
MKCSQGNAFLVDYIRNCNSAWWSAVSLSQITMGTVLLLLSLFTLLHITYGNPLDCSTQIKGTPPNFTQINGLWNIQVSSSEMGFKMKGVVYIFSRISANEKEANISFSYNPLSEVGNEINVQRVKHNSSGDLSYEFEFTDGTQGMLTIVQPNQESLIIYYKANGVYKMASLYYQETPSRDQGDHFRKWSKCKNLLHTLDLDISFNYAEKCPGLFEESDDLDHIKDFISLNLVGKAVSSDDVFSRFKTLYTARLEILHFSDKYTVREFKTKTVEYKQAEFNFIKGLNTDYLKMSTFKMAKDLLLLGVRKGSSRTLYLASKTFKVDQQILDTFMKQALCFGNRYVYFVPGTRESDHGVSCFGSLEDVTPLPVSESLGRWNLAISAQRFRQSLMNDVANSHSAIELREEEGKYFLTQVTIPPSPPLLEKNTPVEVKDGYLSFPGSNKPVLRHFSSNCALHSSDDQGDALFVFCRSYVLNYEDNILFTQYAVCQKFTNLVFRRQSALSCLNIPAKVKHIDPEKLSGKWKVEASATYLSRKELNFPTEMEFTGQDQQVIVSQEDGIKITLEKNTTMENSNHKFEDIVDRDYFVVFHRSVGDSLIVWNGRNKDPVTALYLLSKSSKLDPAEVTVFKDFASCFSFTDIRVPE